MKKIFLLGLIGLVFLWTCPVLGQSDMMHEKGNPLEKLALLNSIETGELYWKIFITAIKTPKITFEEVSPPAVANYLEAIANDGLMELIPDEYFYHEDLQVSLSVVFEDPLNICKNRLVYIAYLE
jgi:hypothetical protein